MENPRVSYVWADTLLAPSRPIGTLSISCPICFRDSHSMSPLTACQCSSSDIPNPLSTSAPEGTCNSRFPRDRGRLLDDVAKDATIKHDW
ncbi:hypothetical protein Hypma_012411 [Hypsizygus marmoreus]|uniref:Uncharacterized protein n=1 Tax=Hypsizygus marmoreus TaxID=39966 RepID=A0A369JL53_HYPMA|nr:hypothetical protein Hypma_012411 [Hypsizygus marmoreus]